MRKEAGGLGIKKAKDHNTALLSKVGWKMLACSPTFYRPSTSELTLSSTGNMVKVAPNLGRGLLKLETLLQRVLN